MLGGNLDGELGDGTTTDSSTPVDVNGLAGDVATLAAGGWRTCALISGGGVKCWGRNVDGGLGDGTTASRNTPVDVSGLAGGVDTLTVGPFSFQTCVVLTNQRPKCWGWDGYGQLGLGTIAQRVTPTDVIASGSPHIQLNYANGQRGSYFTLTGENFPAGFRSP